MEWIPSIYVLCYLFLLQRLILTLYFTRGFWWLFISPRAPWFVIGSYTSMKMVHTFNIACVGSWQPAGEFVIVSIIYWMVKSFSSNKLKPILFPSGGNQISYLRTVASQNGVYVRSSSHGTNLIQSGLWRRLYGSWWSSKSMRVFL